MSKKLFLDRLSKLSSESDLELFNQLGKALEEMELHTEQSLQALYRQVDQACTTGMERFVIYGAVLTPEQAGLHRGFLPPIPTEKEADAIATGYVALDLPALKGLEGQIFTAMVQTKAQTYHIQVRAARSRQYVSVLRKLRGEFFYNNLSWRHLHIPGLAQFFSFFPCNGLPWETDEEILAVSLDLAEWQPFWSAEAQLVWNLESVRLPCLMLPRPARDRIHFEHQLYQDDEDCGFLVQENVGIQYVTRTDKGLSVITSEEESALWDAWKVIPVTQRALLPEDLQLDGNGQNLTHTDRQVTNALRFLQTRANISRLFASYDAARPFALMELHCNPESAVGGTMVGSEPVSEIFPEDFPRPERMIFRVEQTGRTAYPVLTLSFLMAEMERHLPGYRCEAALMQPAGGEAT